MNKTLKLVISFVLVAVAVTCFIVFECAHVKITPDNEVLNLLLTGIIYHLAVCAAIIWFILFITPIHYLNFKNTTLKGLLWCLPCLLVALVNFPYFGLIKGDVTIQYGGLMGLYILYIISIALLEELVFRGILLSFFMDLFKNNKLQHFWSVLITSVIFALFHFANLLNGENIITVLQQVGYTFLIGAMFAVVTLKTKNLWLAVVLHAIFDFGGLLTGSIATGDPHKDVVFWILTIACGILCAGHIIVSLINLDKKHVS